jgi:hypothetical protein
MNLHLIHGDLLDQDVDVIVNAWNRNIIPWWLLLPQGVSGAIKRRGGTGPFKELRKHGSIPLGGAVLTSAGKLPFKAIVHAAGINMLWRASELSIRESVRNAMALAHEKGSTSPSNETSPHHLQRDRRLLCPTLVHTKTAALAASWALLVVIFSVRRWKGNRLTLFVAATAKCVIFWIRFEDLAATPMTPK